MNGMNNEQKDGYRKTMFTIQQQREEEKTMMMVDSSYRMNNVVETIRMLWLDCNMFRCKEDFITISFSE